ncbi:MAG: hypothetical protein QOH01_1997 [Verrucomicrobiota bacterium]|jgi:hypothetical protein
MDIRTTAKIPAAYTYFGQFIDHDLTSEAYTPADSGPLEPRDLPNLRRHWLNLDCLYGDTPGKDANIYEDDEVSFRVGNPLFDVPLGADCIPRVADHRNLENPLVRQVHAMFLLLHNAALTEIPGSLPASVRLRAARRRVCHQYQWLVRHDFLPMICEPDTYASILNGALIDWDGRFSIPTEFARAAFRFGHSMVRDSYTLTAPTNFSLKCLLRVKPTRPLRRGMAIRWGTFAGPSSSEHAARINTEIACELFHVPDHSVRLYRSIARETGEIALPWLTLRRGVAALLPCGQTVTEILGTKPIDPNPDLWANLAAVQLEKETPLWYYLLLEAASLEDGRCLGPVGSRIIAETIEGALWANPDSYLRCYGRDWLPEPWLDRSSGRWRQIVNLYDLAVVVGLAP